MNNTSRAALVAALRQQLESMVVSLADDIRTDLRVNGYGDIPAGWLDVVIRQHLRDLLASLDETPPQPVHEHDYQNYWTCRICGQTEAAIHGCHHCDETTVGSRCNWCLRLRAVEGTLQPPPSEESHGGRS